MLKAHCRACKCVNKESANRHKVKNAAVEACGFPMQSSCRVCRNVVVKREMVSSLPTVTAGESISSKDAREFVKRMVVQRIKLSRSPECLDIECRCLNLSIHRHAFVLPSIKEVLTLVADEGPLSKCATGVTTRSRRSACWLDAGDGIDVDALLLE